MAGAGSAPSAQTHSPRCHVRRDCDRPVGGPALCCSGSDAQWGQGWATGCSILCKGSHRDLGTSGASVASSTCREGQPGCRPAASRHHSLLQRRRPHVEIHLLPFASASPGLALPAPPRQDESGITSFSTSKRSTKRHRYRESQERAPVQRQRFALLWGLQCPSPSDPCLKREQSLKPSCKRGAFGDG